MSQRKKSADWMRQIDENLRRVYDETASEAIPDRFQRLLEELKEQDAPK
jgi:hemerythrin-like domain-containing protein